MLDRYVFIKTFLAVFFYLLTLFLCVVGFLSASNAILSFHGGIYIIIFFMVATISFLTGLFISYEN